MKGAKIGRYQIQHYVRKFKKHRLQKKFQKDSFKFQKVRTYGNSSNERNQGRGSI